MAKKRISKRQQKQDVNLNKSYSVVILAVGIAVYCIGRNIVKPIGYGTCEMNHIPDDIQELDEFPYKCGMQEIPNPNKDIKVYAYTQIGLWCWSNAGFIHNIQENEVTLIDVLTDVKQTERFIREVKRLAPGAVLKDLIYTHCDIDHWFGQQVIYDEVENIYAADKCKDAMEVWKNSKISSTITVSHYIWQMVKFIGIEHFAQKIAPQLKLSEFFAPFDFYNVDLENIKYPKSISDFRKDWAKVIQLKHSCHSNHDIVIYIDNIVFTGDIVFSGVTPLMWAGTFMDCIRAVEEVAQVNARYVIPGHGAITNTFKDMKDYWQSLSSCYNTECREVDADACADACLKGIPARFKKWDDPGRMVINMHTQYAYTNRTIKKNKLELMIKQISWEVGT